MAAGASALSQPLATLFITARPRITPAAAALAELSAIAGRGIMPAITSGSGNPAALSALVILSRRIEQIFSHGCRG